MLELYPQQFAATGTHRMRMVHCLWLCDALIATAASADVPASRPDAEPTLEGWGTYKFGMTIGQVQKLGGHDWYSLPLMPGAGGAFLAARDKNIEQYGLRFTGLILLFDRDEKLFRIQLSYERGGPTLDGCRQKFEDLLRQLDAQYGPFQPFGYTSANPTAAAIKTTAERSLSRTQSHYREVEMGPVGSGPLQADGMFMESARRSYGKGMITVSMNAVDNPRLSGAPMIPAAVIAIDPKLALPVCRLNVVVQSRDMDVPASGAMMPSIGPKPAPPAAQPDTDRIMKAGQNFLATAKRMGLTEGPTDLLLDAYSWERARNDDEDAAALLERMAPAQKAMAAYMRHDYPEAAKLWKPLAEKGDAEAAASVASLYEYGLNGMTKDENEAARWRKVAATLGDGNSQEALGEKYADGEGVSKDNVRAYVWLSLGLAKAQTGPWKSWFPQQITKKLEAVAEQLSPAELQRAQALLQQCTASLKSCAVN
jgi:hypothetical protein